MMAKLSCVLGLILIVAISAERISPSSSRDSASSSRDSSSSGNGLRDFGFDSGRPSSSGSASRAGSVNSNRGTSSSSWADDDNDDNDLSTTKITPWKGGVIPYDISSDISTSNSAALKRMFQDISDKTCVRFVQKKSSDANYALVKSGNKCSAPLGMTTSSSGSSLLSGSSGSRQTSSSSSSVAISNVVLGQSCFTTKRVGRRIMNLLGIPHETSRPDRDQFVEINFNNLRTGYANQVKQIASSAYLPGVLDVPYDTQSITQYSDDDLAKDTNTWAIRTKGRRSADLGGDMFSSADFEKIRRAYNCPSSSSGSSFGSGSRG